MTKERQEHLERAINKVQMHLYYQVHKDDVFDDLLKTVNGNKDRLIKIMAVMLSRHNDRIGSIDVTKDEHFVKVKNDKIDEILLKM